MIKIRSAVVTDVKELLSIYTPYIKETAITFETTVPTEEEFSQRVERILQDFPYLVAVEEKKILGYAYASPYYNRSAYDWTVELSVYVAQDARGKGVGGLLYCHLEEVLLKRGFKNLLACIALPNDASLKMHEKMGYEQVAHFKKVGYKFGVWHDIVWLQKSFVEEE